MKKFLIILMVLSGAVVAGVQAQDYIKDGDALFTAGKYEEAKVKYKAWNSFQGETAHTTKRIGQCDQCMQLLPVAHYLFTSGNLDEARAKYSEILAINPDDPTAKTRVRQIPDNLGVRIGNVVWATRNVSTTPKTFTRHPEEYGGYYTWEQAKNACPGGWRLPTYEEIKILENKQGIFTTENAVTGRKFDGLFMPACGFYEKDNPTMLSLNGLWAKYWSITEYSSKEARTFSFKDEKLWTVWEDKPDKQSVRCVAE